MHNFGYLIMDVAKKLRHQLNMTLEKGGITSAQWAVLAQMGLAESPLTSAQIADMVGMDRATISGVVKRLEAKELVHIQTSSEDRRARTLTLTDSGEQMFKHCQRIADLQISEFSTPLNAEEQEALVQLLMKLEEGHDIG